MDTNEIYQRLAALKARVEANNEAHIDGMEAAWLYDIALALGLSKTQAEALANDPASAPAPARTLDLDGETVIKLHYHDGEYLTGYTVYGDDAKLLEKIGLVRYVSGWGYYVDNSTVEKLGKEFRYQDAVDLAAPDIEARQAAEQAAQDERRAAFASACRLGQPVVLRTYTAECNEPDCSLDSVTEYAMPDGTVKVSRSHTY